MGNADDAGCRCGGKGIITHPSGFTESCTACFLSDAAWAPYYAWLDEMYRKKKMQSEGKSGR